MIKSKAVTASPALADRIAALDIGSDTVHLLIGSVEGSGEERYVKHISQAGELLLLGGRVATTGRIGASATNKLEKVVVRLAALGRKRASRLVIGATEALRRAEDGPEIVERLSKACGEPVRILSGAREADLDLAGVGHRLDPTGFQLIIDSGGASTEVTLTDGRHKVAAASLPVGAALLGAGLRGDPPKPLSWALRGLEIGVALACAPDGKPVRAWATGGSAHNLAGLDRTRGKSGPQRLTMSGLSKMASELLAVPSQKLAKRSGEELGRVAILPPGLLIIASVLDHYRLETVTVVPEGVRDGMILAVYDLGGAWWQDQPGDAAPAAGRVRAAVKAPVRRSTRPTAASPKTTPSVAARTPVADS